MTRFIILAAGSGRRLGDALGGRPKCLAELGGRSLLARQLDAARRAGLRDITVVGGYRAECLAPLADDLVVNDEFDTTNMVASLFRAEEMFADDFVMSYGDIAYRDAFSARTMFMTDMLQMLIDTGVAVTAVEIEGGWVEIDHSSDLAVAERLVAEGRLDG